MNSSPLDFSISITHSASFLHLHLTVFITDDEMAVCTFFGTKRGCRYGRNCTLQHVDSPMRASSTRSLDTRPAYRQKMTKPLPTFSHPFDRAQQCTPANANSRIERSRSAQRLKKTDQHPAKTSHRLVRWIIEICCPWTDDSRNHPPNFESQIIQTRRKGEDSEGL